MIPHMLLNMADIAKTLVVGGFQADLTALLHGGVAPRHAASRLASYGGRGTAKRSRSPRKLGIAFAGVRHYGDASIPGLVRERVGSFSAHLSSLDQETQSP